MSRPPPDITRAVFYIKVETTIDAPSGIVWNAILDFPSYPTWNPFVRSQAITDSSFRPLLAHPRPSQGAHIIMHVRTPARGLDDNDKGLRSSKDIITFVDETNYRIVWQLVGMPKWFLRAERWQEVTEEQVDGKPLTKYMTVEVFHGLGAWIIRWFMGAKLLMSFKAMANGLKKHCEGLADST